MRSHALQALTPAACWGERSGGLGFAYNNEREMPLSKGDAAPDFKIQSIDGGELTMESLKGKKVFLTFFRYAGRLPALQPPGRGDQAALRRRLSRGGCDGL